MYIIIISVRMHMYTYECKSVCVMHKKSQHLSHTSDLARVLLNIGPDTSLTIVSVAYTIDPVIGIRLLLRVVCCVSSVACATWAPLP